jgi:hypothetical protein
LLPNFFRKDRNAITAFRENNPASQSRHARADNCDVSVHSEMIGTDRRGVRKIFPRTCVSPL